MKLTFIVDNTPKKTVEIDFFGENLIRGVLNASANIAVGNTEADVPSVSALRVLTSFDRVSVTDKIGGADVEIPVQGSYNTVRDVNVTYNSMNKIYTVSLILEYVESAEEA